MLVEGKIYKSLSPDGYHGAATFLANELISIEKEYNLKDSKPLRGALLMAIMRGIHIHQIDIEFAIQVEVTAMGGGKDMLTSQSYMESRSKAIGKLTNVIEYLQEKLGS